MVLRLYHSGTANTNPEAPGQSVVELVRCLRSQKNIVCFGVTENGQSVDLHSYETSVQLKQAGLVPLYDTPEQVALAKAQLLESSLTTVQLIEEMLDNKVGEIDSSMIIDADVALLKDLYRN